MKKVFFGFIPLLLVISTTVYSQTKKTNTTSKAITLANAVRDEPLDCKKYHTGMFKISEPDFTIILKRTADKQYEYANGSLTPTVFNIKWKDDCTCTLTPTAETVKRHLFGLNKGNVLTVQIVRKNTASVTQLVSANYTKVQTTSELYPTNESPLVKSLSPNKGELLLTH